jgi:hypothetical protein
LLQVAKRVLFRWEELLLCHFVFVLAPHVFDLFSVCVCVCVY